ncbi:MAG: osmoprotectant transporter permease [Saprospiraceae bacterium]|nr:osmoprotectant transporter permease [Saprospiraceae bacterium]
MLNNLFWVVWVIVALTALVFLYFFIIGLADHSVSSFNIKLWMVTLIVFPVILAGSYWLKNHQYIKIAIGLLLIPAIPAVLYLLFLLVVLFSGPVRWN